MFNVHQLNVFTTAAETLNFTTAARKLHMTQSSVSQHIKSLENQLKTKLFKRKGRSLELTDSGKYFLPLARDIVKDSIRAEEKMQLFQQSVHGELTFGCNTAPGKYILPILIAEFHKQYPLVKIACRIVPQDHILEQLSSGEIHFAFINVGDRSERDADMQLYMREPIHLIVPKGHHWANKRRIRPEELYEESFIMREETSGGYQSVQRELNRAGIDISRLDTYLVMGTSEAIAMAVEEGLGVGFVSEMIISKICQGVGCVEIEGVNFYQDICIAKQTQRAATSAQAAFWEFIKIRNSPFAAVKPITNSSLVR